MNAGAVRPALPADLGDLLELCSEHARFERALVKSDGFADSLYAALFGPTPRVKAWVATVQERAIGYVTVIEAFSTWAAEPFLELDCLFVRPGHRNRRVGTALLSAVVEYGRELGVREMQWQTPDWNTDACRFYERHGASAHRRVRFCLQIKGQ